MKPEHAGSVCILQSALGENHEPDALRRTERAHMSWKRIGERGIGSVPDFLAISTLGRRRNP